MKTSSVKKTLGRFKSVMGNDGSLYFYSRRENHGHRLIKVIDQGENCVALPITQQDDGQEQVIFHAKTIKSLVEFLEAGWRPVPGKPKFRQRTFLD
jgi:hypothetical protein